MSTADIVLCCPGTLLSTFSNEMQGFAARSADRFPFLHPSSVQDSKKRRPGDPSYDPRTLYLQPDFYKKYKISEGQRQWYLSSPFPSFLQMTAFGWHGPLKQICKQLNWTHMSIVKIPFHVAVARQLLHSAHREICAGGSSRPRTLIP